MNRVSEEFEGDLEELLQSDDEDDSDDDSRSRKRKKKNKKGRKKEKNTENHASQFVDRTNWYNFSVTFQEGSLGFRLTKDEFGRGTVTNVSDFLFFLKKNHVHFFVFLYT